jgi:RimJ/RimL family protein N-acetyltransferase
MAIPTLETLRLRLRGHRASDHADAAAMWADPAVVRHIGGRPFTSQETWFKILRYVGHWELLGFGYWAVEDKASGRFVGDVGLADFKRELDPPLEGTPEMGWVLAPWAHGRGYATEAVAAALAWADTTLAARRTVCLIDPPNSASLRVAEKSGYRYVRAARLGEVTTGLHERVR